MAHDGAVRGPHRTIHRFFKLHGRRLPHRDAAAGLPRGGDLLPVSVVLHLRRIGFAVIQDGSVGADDRNAVFKRMPGGKITRARRVVAPCRKLRFVFKLMLELRLKMTIQDAHNKNKTG